MVFEQRGKQNGFVGYGVAVALQGLWHVLKSQVGVGRNEVEVKRDVFHGAIT